MSHLKKLGFQKYEDFMSDMLLEELESREMKMTSQVPIFSSVLKSMKALALSIQKETFFVLKAYDSGKYVPLNLEIESSHIQDSSAGSLSVVAAQYQKMINEIKSEIGSFENRVDVVVTRILENQFLYCAGSLLNELSKFFQVELQKKSEDHEASLNEKTYIDRLIIEADEKSKKSTLYVFDALYKFESICNTMRTAAIGLEIVRLTGKIESARLSSMGSNFTGLIDQLGEFRKNLTSSFDKITAALKDLKSNASMFS